MTVLHNKLRQIDTKELDLPETLFVRDIESRVFQSIALHCLSRIEGVGLLEGSLIDSLLGRDGPASIKGIHVEQEEKRPSVNFKVEIKVAYGVAIPEKAEEIQLKIAQDVSRLTGLHVGRVHVVFKDLIFSESIEEAVRRASGKHK
ncbi:MAG: Asp23/Gls24 family envelope stress response protein [Anaplasmataceae bacterium]|nr:Asp23/Gls24 family envelope stress response protein [Anaplasmataceae bacterium]